MTQFLQATADGIAFSPVYIFTAAGFVILYRATAVFNFAQGAFMLVGAYLLYEFSVTLGLPTAVAVLFSIAGISAFSGGMYLTVLRPLTGQPLFGVIIVTMGLSIVITGLCGVIWGFEPKGVARPEVSGVVHIGDVHISAYDLWVLGISAVLLLALGAFFKYTAMGLQMRATAESAILSSRRGVRVQWVYTLGWLLAGAVSGVGGVILAFNSGFATPSIAAIGLLAFPAALLGGFDSLLGAVVGGVVVACVQTWATMWWGAEIRDSIVFALMIAVLMLRPNGLFGSVEIGRL